MVARPKMSQIDAAQGQVEGIVRPAAYLGGLVGHDVGLEGSSRLWQSVIRVNLQSTPKETR